MPSAAARLAVFDLDGTVLTGDGPVRRYLREIGERAELPGDAEAVLEAFLTDGGDAADAYSVVAGLAERAGVPRELRNAAYAASRAALHDGDVEAATAPSLAAVLAGRPAGVVCALVTNAPVAGAEALLRRLGLEGRFDRVLGDAGKPAGMPAVLADLLRSTGVAGEHLLAVGDVWANDLAAAAALGGTTALIDHHGRAGGAPDLRGPSLEALLPAIARWWS